MVDPKILSKIKKCLALGSSPNPHEAAAAMRQAHALMSKHGVDAQGLAMAELGESSLKIRTMARDKPAKWEAQLAATVGKAFGCKLLISRNLYPSEYRKTCNEGTFIFIGQKAQAEVAAYTASVLARKCKVARQKWISEHLSGFHITKAKMTRMGDAFAEGWVNSIAKLVSDFANPPEIDEAINRKVEGMSSGSDAPTRGKKSHEMDHSEVYAVLKGSEAAAGESIYRPMNTREAPLAIS